MSSASNSNKSHLKSESGSVPWEPYKAATSKNSFKGKNISKQHETFFSDRKKDELVVNNDNLVRYKISTDLDLFNSQRPGYQFDECDFQLIENKLIEKFPGENEFMDARFYTDFHFLKLANELKKKCVSDSSSSSINSSTKINNIPNSSQNAQPSSNISKPINVVVPLVEKKADSIKNSPPDNGSIKIWKAQLSKYESRIDYLEDQIKGIYESLQIQTQVNAELKKLLVASIGEDIQYKIERLVNDKQRYEFELKNNAKELERMSEEVEQISIRCDMYRSKFLACRLMSDEASTWKSFLLLLNRQNEKVLKNLLVDNELLNEKLNLALDLISQIKENSSSDANLESNKINKRNINNLKAANILLTSLSSLTNKNLNFENIKKNSNNKSKTFNETIATQMLEQFDWVKQAINENNHFNLGKNLINNVVGTSGSLSQIDSFEKLELLLEKLKINRSTIHKRLYQSTELNADSDLLINVCNYCTGQIKVV